LPLRDAPRERAITRGDLQQEPIPIVQSSPPAFSWARWRRPRRGLLVSGQWISHPNGRRTADLERETKPDTVLEHRSGTEVPKRTEGQVEAQDAETIC
jgi:hypothetical protein